MIPRIIWNVLTSSPYPFPSHTRDLVHPAYRFVDWEELNTWWTYWTTRSSRSKRTRVGLWGIWFMAKRWMTTRPPWEMQEESQLSSACWEKLWMQKCGSLSQVWGENVCAVFFSPHLWECQCNISTTLINYRKIKLYTVIVFHLVEGHKITSFYLQLQLMITFVTEYFTGCLFFFQGTVTKNSEQRYWLKQKWTNSHIRDQSYVF